MKDMHPVLRQIVRNREINTMRRLRMERAGFGDERIGAVGLLTIVLLDALTGEIRHIDHGHNLVTNLGRSALAHLLGSGDSNYMVDRIQFGDSNTTPDVTQTGMQGSIILMQGGAQFKTTNNTYPDPPPGLDLKAQFEATVAADEGNGAGTQVYREAGLFLVNSDMFSRKITGDITKDDTVVLTATWTIVF